MLAQTVIIACHVPVFAYLRSDVKFDTVRALANFSERLYSCLEASALLHVIPIERQIVQIGKPFGEAFLRGRYSGFRLDRLTPYRIANINGRRFIGAAYADPNNGTPILSGYMEQRGS